MSGKKADDAQTEESHLPLLIPDNESAMRFLDALERASDELSRRSEATLPATCTVLSYTNGLSFEQSILLEPRSMVRRHRVVSLKRTVLAKHKSPKSGKSSSELIAGR